MKENKTDMHVTEENDNKTACEILKQIIDQQSVEVNARELLYIQKTLQEVAAQLKGMPRSHWNDKYYLHSHEHTGVVVKLEMLTRYIKQQSDRVRMPEIYIPVVNGMLREMSDVDSKP